MLEALQRGAPLASEHDDPDDDEEDEEDDDAVDDDADVEARRPAACKAIGLILGRQRGRASRYALCSRAQSIAWASRPMWTPGAGCSNAHTPSLEVAR